MAGKLVWIFFFFSSLLHEAIFAQKCVWYGTCGNDTRVGVEQNCHDAGPPRQLDDTSSAKLQSICPELVDNNGVALTCCDAEQIEELFDYLRHFGSYLSDSDACWNNFKNYHCYLHCGPNQGAYLFPQKLIPHKNMQNFTIHELEYMVTKVYAEGLFNSCVNAVDPLTGDYALEHLCGLWGRDQCNGERWLNTLGDPENSTSPILINVTVWNNSQIFHRKKYFYPLDLELHDEFSDGVCEWYGECGENPFNNRSPINCFSSMASKALPSTSIKQLFSICPELVKKKGQTRTCCDGNQIQTLKTFLSYSYQHLSECPSCWNNFRQFFCQMTCSPKQSEFLRAHETITTTDHNKTAIVETEYLVNEDFITTFYESCRAATTSAGVKVLDIMCGTWGNDQCTISRWLEYLGDNSYTPFITKVSTWEINANITKSGRNFTPMNVIAEHFPCHEENTCVWYGQCGNDPNTGLPMNCYDFNPPRQLEYQKTITHLKSVCPELIDGKGNALTCCDKHQISTLVDNLQSLSSLTSHCPACYHNLRQLFCNLKCSPHQSDFMYPQKLITYQGRSAIKEVGFLISQSYSDGLFNSCASVHYPKAQGYLMDYLCGQWGQKFCTTRRLLDNLGSSDNGISSFVTNYTFWNRDIVQLNGKTFHPLDEPIIPCNEAVGKTGPSCTCDDCSEAC